MMRSAAGFRVVIPARMGSTRFPGKPLAKIAGRTMIERVWRQASHSGASEVIVATDSEEIADVARDFGATVQITGTDLQSGTDRVAEVARRLGWDTRDVVVNVQGDAPLIPPECIDAVAEALAGDEVSSLGTLCAPLESNEAFESTDVVKVVLDRFQRALYFSRAPIPARAHGRSDGISAYRHIGLYAYRVGDLLTLADTPPCELELAESLEQLRALWLGMRIIVAMVETPLPPDVDTPDDLARVAALLE